MRDFHTLVLAPESAADTSQTIVEHIRARGLDVWSERLEHCMPDASLAWADTVIVVDPAPNAFLARTLPWERQARILVASADLSGDARAELLDDGFDHVLTADCSPLVIAALTERLMHRGTLPIARLLESMSPVDA